MDNKLFSQIRDRCLAYVSDDYMWMHNFVSIVSSYKEQIPNESRVDIVVQIIINLLQEKLIVYLDNNYEEVVDIDTLTEEIKIAWEIYSGNFPLFYMTFMATEKGKEIGKKIDNWRQ